MTGTHLQQLSDCLAEAAGFLDAVGLATSKEARQILVSASVLRSRGELLSREEVAEFDSPSAA